MAPTYPSSIINARLQVVENAIDGGSSSGRVRITDSSSNVLITVILADPAGSVAGGVLTFNGMPLTAISAVSGTAALARIEDSNGNIVISGLIVSTGNTDVTITSTSGGTSIVSGQSVALTAGSLTGH